MAKAKSKRSVKSTESDSTYFLKLVMYLVLSSIWVRISQSSGAELPIPVGAIIALLFASHEHFQIDRKIEYAIILLTMFIAFWLPMGVYIS